MRIETITIEGGSYLTGEVTLSESVLAAKHALIAGVLSKEATLITNPPDCKALAASMELFSFLGAEIVTEEGVLILGETISTLAIPKNDTLSKFELVLIWATLLARFGKAGIAETVVAANSHIRGVLETFGVTVELESHYVVAYTSQKEVDRTVVIPQTIPFEERVLSGLVALTMAATLPSKTCIRKFVPSEEYDILRDILVKMGVTIEGDYPEIVVVGSKELSGTSYEVPPSGREALLYLSLVALSDGDVRICNFPSRSLARVTKRLQDRGVEFSVDNDTLRVWGTEGAFLPSIQTVEESQRLSHSWHAILAVLSSLSDGESQFYIERQKGTDIANILTACGIEVTVLPFDEDTVNVRIFGPGKFKPTKLTVSSYETGVVALLCAQSAKGVSTVHNAEHISDVHQDIFHKLKKLGMKISGYEE